MIALVPAPEPVLRAQCAGGGFRFGWTGAVMRWLGRVALAVLLMAGPAGFAQTAVTEGEAAEAEIRANAEMAAGNYRKALPEIERVLDYIRSVENVAQQRAMVLKAEQLVFFQAFCYVATEQFEEAVPILDRFLSLYPRSTNLKTAYTLKIHSLTSLERWEETRDTLEFVLKNLWVEREERMELLMAFAEVNRTLERHEEAFPHFGTVMRNAGDPSLKMTAISRMLESILLLKQTERLYQLIPMLQGPVSPAAYSLQFNLQAIEAADRLAEGEVYAPALVLLKLCKPIEEIREGLAGVEGYLIRRVEALKAEIAGGVVNLYELIAVQRRLAQVQAEIEAARSADDYNEGLQYRLAQVLTRMDMLYEAYWAYDRLLREAPASENAPLALFSTSALAAELGLPERAVEHGKALLKRFPDFELAPETAFNLAYVYEQNQDIGSMLEVLRDAVDRGIVTRKEADRGHAFFLMGYANLFLDRFDEAEGWFERVRREVGNSRYVVDAEYWSAYSLMFRDAYAEAIAKLEAFLAAHPRSRYAMDVAYRVALARFGSGDLEGTEAAAVSFIERYPDSPLRGEAHNLLGDVYGGLGRADEALEAYGLVELFTTQAGQVHSAVFNAGRILEANGRWAELIDHFQRYLNRYGDEGFYTRAVYEIGKGYKNTGQAEAALALYWETFQRFADDPAALGADLMLSDFVEDVQAHWVSNKTQALADAREAARRTAAGTPEALEARERMSREEREAQDAAVRLAEKEAAEADLRAAQAEARTRVMAQLRDEVRRSDGDAGGLTRNLRLRYALVRAGDEEAEPSVITETLVNAGSPEVLLWLGGLLEGRRQTDLAVTAYERILEEFEETPATVTAYVKLGTLELERGNAERALSFFRTVHDRYPTSEWTGMAVMRIGDILFEQEKYGEAAETYEEVVLVREWKGPLWPEALYKLGLCLFRSGEVEKAFAYFQRVYVLYAGHPEWAARAYLESGKCLEALERSAEAAQTYREMLAQPPLAETRAGEQARIRLSNLPPQAVQAAHDAANF